ncbi:MAG: CPBP family intramembrane glutamic endopeptidase [Bacilli bacterium]
MRPTVATRWILFIIISQVLVIGVFFGLPHLPLASWLLAKTKSGLLAGALITDLGEAMIALSLYGLIVQPLGLHVPIIGRRDDRVWSVVLGLSALLAVVIVTWMRNPGLTFDSGFPLHWSFMVNGPKMLVVAICEEYVFRGVMLTLAVRRWGAFRGILLASLVFAAFHWGLLIFHSEFLASPHRFQLPYLYLFLSQFLIPMLSLFISGLCFSYIYLRSRALIWPIATHWVSDYATWNPTTTTGYWVSQGLILASGILAAEILHFHRTGRLFGLQLRETQSTRLTASGHTDNHTGDVEDA